MSETSYPCHDCGRRIEDTNCPIVIYVVAGLAPMHPVTKAGGGTADITDFPMPQVMRDLFSLPIPRLEFCVGCFAARMGHNLIDAQGEVMATPDKALAFMETFASPLSVVDGVVVNSALPPVDLNPVPVPISAPAPALNPLA